MRNKFKDGERKLEKRAKGMKKKSRFFSFFQDSSVILLTLDLTVF